MSFDFPYIGNINKKFLIQKPLYASFDGKNFFYNGVGEPRG